MSLPLKKTSLKKKLQQHRKVTLSVADPDPGRVKNQDPDQDPG
jgi:hypothetical protein